jgi:hypothetical protein
VDTVSEFTAGDRDRGSVKRLEALHRSTSPFDRTVILLDQIV